MQGYSGRPTLCRTCSCCSTWSLHTRTTWNWQQEAEQQKTTHAGVQAALLMVGVAPLRRPRMTGLYDLPPPPPSRMGEHNALNEDHDLKMTVGNVCFIEFF
jgi:hypothetical protein